MKKTSKIVALIIFAVVILPILMISFYTPKFRRYEQAFSQLRIGEVKQSVINLMGEASETRSCNFSMNNANNNQVSNCFEIINYNLPYQRWAFAFDKEGIVIKKYYWFFGEYGNRPPDQLF